MRIRNKCNKSIWNCLFHYLFAHGLNSVKCKKSNSCSTWHKVDEQAHMNGSMITLRSRSCSSRHSYIIYELKCARSPCYIVEIIMSVDVHVAGVCKCKSIMFQSYDLIHGLLMYLEDFYHEFHLQMFVQLLIKSINCMYT
jgi:hypothetical protein